MLKFDDKISFLEEYLTKPNNLYTDAIKADILIYLDVFDIQNTNLKFLENLSSKEEIENWVNKLISRIILKYDEKGELLTDFIYDYIILG